MRTGRWMTICDHAIRRYKKRVGNRTSSKRRICDLINKQIERDVVRTYKHEVSGHLMIETSKFTAVCYKRTVITILLPHEVYMQQKQERQDRAFG